MACSGADVRQRMRNFLLACRFVAFPFDRPSPFFVFLSIFLNGGLLVWSFGVVVGPGCAALNKAWLSLGIVHAIVNQIFAIYVMFTTRRKIEKGIPLTTTGARLFLRDPAVWAYLIYLVWEVVWMASVLRCYTESESNDRCRKHQVMQAWFFLAYLVLGAASFLLTFATEWRGLPHWRRQAHLNWALSHHSAMQDQSNSTLATHLGGHEDQESGLMGNTNESYYYYREGTVKRSSSRTKREHRDDIAHDYSTLSETLSMALPSMRESKGGGEH